MRLAQLVLACLALLVAAFCGFGFLASYEAVPNAALWKAGYASVGGAGLAATGLLVRRALWVPKRSGG